MSMIGSYKNDVFDVYKSDNHEMQINTCHFDKAKKYSMSGNSYDGFAMLVPEEEVDIYGDDTYYRRFLFNLEEDVIKYLPTTPSYEFTYTIHKEILKILRLKKLLISNGALIAERGDSIFHGDKTKIEWEIYDGLNGYHIIYTCKSEKNFNSIGQPERIIEKSGELLRFHNGFMLL